MKADFSLVSNDDMGFLVALKADYCLIYKSCFDLSKYDILSPVIFIDTKADASLINKLPVLRDQLVIPKTDLEVLQKDPNSPLYSVKSFEALHL